MQPINHPKLHHAAIRICEESNLSGYTNKLGIFVKIKTDGEKEMESNVKRINRTLEEIKTRFYDLDKKILDHELKIKEQGLATERQIVSIVKEEINKRMHESIPIRKGYRVTWRHELYFNASDDKNARDIWDNVDLGKLTEEAKRFTTETDMYNEFVEEKSFECVDDNYRDVVKNPQ